MNVNDKSSVSSWVHRAAAELATSAMNPNWERRRIATRAARTKALWSVLCALAACAPLAKATDTAVMTAQSITSLSSDTEEAAQQQQKPKITILAPANNSTVTSLPVTLKVSFRSAANASKMQALLDGADITSLFSPADANGVRQAQVDRPAVNLGKNQLQVSVNKNVASASFWVSDGLRGSSSGLPLGVPIKTRVLTGSGDKATDYNIALYKDPNNPTNATLIPAPALSEGSNTGFQIVYLKRSDLSVVSNASFPNPDSPNDNSFINGPNAPFVGALISAPPAGCGSVGCLMVIQSLGHIGYAACTAQHSNDCTLMAGVFGRLGGSGRIAFANGDSSVIAYSFIGNTTTQGPVPAGTYFERLTCSSNNYNGGTGCDTLGYPNTSFTAPSNATPDQIGNISGLLIRDNFQNYTYADSAPQVSFSTATDPGGLSHTITVDGVPYYSSSLNGSQGGFHLLVLNSENLSVELNATYPSAQNGDGSEVAAMAAKIGSYASYGNLFIICAFGNTTYQGQYRSNWYQQSQFMAKLGGTQQVFYLLNNPENNPVNHDDYTLVGFFVDQQYAHPVPTGLEGLVGAEMSSVIARETEVNPQSSDMEGVLKMGHQGYYVPGSYGHNHNLTNVTISEALSASLMPPTPWPFPVNNLAKSQAAYTWISQQLCCDDVRAAYVNLNASPSLWLSQLQGLTFNSSVLPNSDAANFNAMKQQLATEFEYVALIRLFQTNVTSLYQDQQANISLLLQQAQNEVISNLQLDLNTPAQSPSWVSIVSDVFGVAQIVAGFTGAGPVPVGTALSLGTFVLSKVSEYTNTPAGSSLKAEENVETTAGNMANKAANEFSLQLVSLGNEFDRIATDWGRLKRLGAPLLADEIPWDANASGILLQAYDRRVSREFYTKLLMPNTVIQVVPYTNDSIYIDLTFGNDNNRCEWPKYVQNNPQLLYYPNGLPNTDKNDPHGNAFPYDYQWGMWTLIFAQHQGDECPGAHHPFPSTFGLFKPLDPGDPTALGMYRLWFYTRENYPVVINNSQTPCYDGSC
ncbi:MAG: hypothetical protein JO182_17620 [Acidobacteriaceae bacterium]|nr:hypothetical protein [Acidobacteriaceae bacterium]